MTMTMTMVPQGDDGRNVMDFYTSRGDFVEENEIKGRLILLFGFWTLVYYEWLIETSVWVILEANTSR